MVRRLAQSHVVSSRALGLASISATLVLFVASIAQSQEVTHEYVPGEIIVKLKGKAKTLQAQAFIGKAVSEKAMTLKGSWAGLNMHHFALKPGEKVEARIAELQADPEVEYAEPNYIVRRQSAGFEGEPVAMSEVQATATYDTSSFSQTSAPIQLAEGWSAESPNLSPPIVAVIDTGIDFNHEVFRNSNAIWVNSSEVVNGIDDDGNGYVDDIHGWDFVHNSNTPQDDDGHGTHVSGIVLGATQSITASPVPQAKIRIMPLKFLDSNGSGTTSDAVKAIYYAINKGAKVLNNSWGGGGFSNALLDAIAYGYDKKVVFVAAAGNASNNNDAAPTYPANYQVPNVISVAATSDIDGFASFSNFGSNTVHMGSPGVSIWSTLPGSLYGRSSGTSMATPFVSGVAALVVREAPEMTGYQVKSVIFSAAQQVSSLSNRTITKSRLNVYNAVLAAKSTTIDSNQPAYSSAAAGRMPDSVDAAPAGGCGLVAKTIYDSNDGPGGPFNNLTFFAVLLVIVSPVLVSVALRNRDGRSRRRHDRYQINSAVTLKVGDRELVGNVSTISLGGVQLNTDAWLENGGIVKMSIRSPDGRDEIQVEGQIVWSEEKKRYGVAFENADQPALSAISRWTAGLLKV